MRFGLAHRLFTEGLALLGLLALIVSGNFDRWVTVALLVGLGLALTLRERWENRPRLPHLDSGLILAIFGIQGARAFLGADLLTVLVEFAAAVQVLRLATRRGAAHDQQVIVLALLHLVAGTVLGGGIGYGLCFFGVLVLAPGALALSHLRREIEGNYKQGARDRSGMPVDVPRILRSKRVIDRRFLLVTCSLSLPIFLFTAGLFVLLPRVGLSLFLSNRSHADRMIGFSDRVNLGEVGVLRTDPTLALRVELPDEKEITEPPLRRAFYLRGTGLDSYDGRGWSQTQSLRRPQEGPTLGLGPAPFHALGTRYRIELTAIDPPVVFLPPGAHSLRTELGLGASPPLFLRGPEDEVRFPELEDNGLKYEVFAGSGPDFSRPSLGLEDRTRYLQLPLSLPARVAELARAWTRGASEPLAKAEAITRHLHAEMRYDLASPSGAAEQPLDHFLFESHRGHCEYFSTALAVLLRAVDVPTRNVTGFVAGTYNRFGRFYAVRQGDAHSWIELWIEGQGWIRMDPTPAAEQVAPEAIGGFWNAVRDFLEATSQRWDRHVVGYDLEQQRSLYDWATSRFKPTKRSRTSAGEATPPWLLLLAFAAVLAIGGYVLLRRRRSIDTSGPSRETSQRAALELYAQLELALKALGRPRPSGTPPLLHAEQLATKGYPLAAEILELTRLYLEVRFGRRPLDETERRSVERRIQALPRTVRELHPREQESALR